MKQGPSCFSAVFASAVLALVLAASANADVRVGHATDPQDVTPDIAGGFVGDLQELDVSYDTSGTLTVTVSFYQAIPDSSGYSVIVHVGEGSTCTQAVTTDAVLATLGATVLSGPLAGIAVNGFQGTAYVPQTVTSNGYGISYTYTGSAIAGRDFRCADAEVFPPSYVSSAPVDTLSTFYFDGFAPVTPPTPPAAAAPPACRVPDVRGMKLAAAKSRLVHADCKLGPVKFAHSSLVAKGRVISETPKPGTRTKALTVVRLIVSSGKRV
jgi:hypothetical protein